MCVTSWLAACLLRLLGGTWRISIEGPIPSPEVSGPYIVPFWHRNLLIPAYVWRDRGFSTAVSRSRDGDLISALLDRLGFTQLPRGSSSRGGDRALLGLVRLIAAGTTVSIQPDGPRGPARRSKMGVVALARLTGVPIVPMALSAYPCVRLRSWDGTLLPLPFARVLCVFGTEIRVARDADPAAKEEARQHLDEQLNRLTDELDGRCGVEIP